MATVDTIKEYAGLFGKQMVLQVAPQVTGGMVNELFHQWEMTSLEVMSDVQNNRSLWDRITPEVRQQIQSLMELVDNLDFITPEVIIEGIKKDFPPIASLLLGWPEGMEWLQRQTESLKAGVSTDIVETKTETKPRKPKKPSTKKTKTS